MEPVRLVVLVRSVAVQVRPLGALVPLKIGRASCREVVVPAVSANVFATIVAYWALVDPLFITLVAYLVPLMMSLIWPGSLVVSMCLTTVSFGRFVFVITQVTRSPA